MDLFSLIKSEFKYFFGNPKRTIPIIAIMFIPLLYTGIFLWSFWDPYGHIDRLPVAIVNLDQGATLDDKKIHIGDDLVERLKKNKKMKWEFVSEQEAKNGLQNQKYFMEIKIPEQLSKQVVDQTKNSSSLQPRLVSITNDRLNFVGSSISRSAAQSLNEEVAQGITKEYSKTLISAVSKLGEGYKKAADGAKKLSDGLEMLQQKSSNVQNGTNKLANGTNELNKGLAEANKGALSLVEGNQKLSTGSDQLSAGLGKLAGGAAQLQAGSSKSLNGLNQLKVGIDKSSAGSQQLVGGLSALAQGLHAYAQAHPELAVDPYFQKLLGTSDQLAGGATQIAKGQAALGDGASKLVAGQTKISGGIANLTQNLAKAADSSKILAAGQKQVLTGSEKLQNGLLALESGSNKLDKGAADLQSGFVRYRQGITEAKNGGQNLTNKLQQASSDVPVINQTQLAKVFSTPIGMQQEKLGNVKKYGTGFAPYFLALGLFVGALLMSIVIDLYNPQGNPKSGFAWFIGKFSIVAIVGLLQALIVDAVLLYGLGLKVQSVTMFIGLSILISFTFIAIVQFLVTSMGNPGRFLAVIFLIFQLASSSGSYPVLLSPPFFQKISPYLPMTYAIDALRYWISGGNHDFMVADVIKITIFMIGFMVLTILYFTIRSKPKRIEDAV